MNRRFEWGCAVSYCALLMFAWPAGALAQVCGAAGGDNRPPTASCVPDAEPASPAGETTVSATAASIDLVTGNKYLHETDARWPDGLVFARHYNSRNAFSRTLGPGWSHSWDTQVARRSPAELQIIQGDGRRRVFHRAPGSGGSAIYRSADPLAGQITEASSSDSSLAFVWRLPDGRELRFDARGRLAVVRDANGRHFQLDYDPASARLRAVRNRAGAALQLTYDVRGRLAELNHPDGRQTRYRYQEQGLLARVEAVDGRTRRYRYEAHSLLQGLTRITDGSDATAAEFAYDDQGRAVASRLAGQAGVQVSYRLPSRAGDPGESTLIHDIDGQTVYRWRYRVHEHRAMMLSARGPGCGICPPADVIRQYDSHGRVLQETWGSGKLTLRWRRDPMGRVREMTWQGAEQDGGLERPQRRRFDYVNDQADAPLAAVHDTSVAPGRERSVRWTYDTSGRLTVRTEAGFAPLFSALDPRLNVRDWQRLERVTRYGYHAIGAARDRLAWVDGPLPGETDRTRFQYDEQGRLAAVLLPEGLSERREYDRLGRLVAWYDPDGVTVRQTWGQDGFPSRIERGDVVSEWRAAGDGSHWLSVQGRKALGLHIDPTGRIQAMTDAQGHRRDVTPQQPMAAGRHPMAPPFSPANGRTLIRDALGAVTLQWRDDFDQLVAESSPQRGFTLNRHDAGGRLVLRAHDSGALEQFAYDALGRLISKGDAGHPRSVQFRWSGTRLVSVSDPVQTLAYRYDPLGRVRAEAVLIGARESLATEPPSALVTQFQRDAFGRVTAQTLPGGHGLGFARDSAGRPTAIALHSADGQRVLLADGLTWQADRTGGARLEGYLAGNGVRFAFQRDDQGRPRQILASRAGAVVDRQAFTHDAQGRIVGIAHNGESIAYAYDDRGRLTGVADPAGAEGFAHDAAGNRMIRLARTGSGAADRIERHRHDRDGRLLSVEPLQGHSTGVRRFGRTVRGDLGLEVAVDAALPSQTPSRDAAWSQARLRGVIRGPHGRAIAAFADQHLLAVYDYDARGLRVRRSTAPSAEHTDLYLHQDGLLTGVADARGRLRQWIVRLGQWPVAELHFDEGRLIKVHWLLADQRAAPLRAFDQRGETVWLSRLSAFGLTRESAPAAAAGGPAQPTSSRPADSLLRLAGHWFDPETGRHENGWRSYVPEHGRYAQPDPLGPQAGSNERTYAQGDPINRIDPFGLYEIDVHYYLTYFLARAAGVSPQRAYTVALAAQYVDDNPQTRPETAANAQARGLYHFVMAGFDTSADASTRYFNPRSPQLVNLYQASSRSLASECARALLLGEFLHTFEDTFSHRDSNNVPFGATLGHLFAGHDPDQTYDVVNSAAPEGSALRRFVDYPWNEERSMRMAQETYGVLQKYFGSTPVASFAQIETEVRRFMQTGAAQYAALLSRAMLPETAAQYAARKERELRDKITVLDEALVRLGLGSFHAQYSDAQGNLYQATYSREAGEANRREYLAGLRHGPTQSTDPFHGVLLPGD